MAYSDYGGFGYRDGERVEGRSDAVITPDKGNIGEPGVYSGFVALGCGLSHEQFEHERDNSADGHVVLGDGPLYVCLYKQSSLTIRRLLDCEFVTRPLLDVGIDIPSRMISEYKGKRYFDSSEADGEVVRFETDGCIIEALFEHSDNYYQFVRLTEPNGAVWTGFSGYGVGAGLEDAGYGFSTGACVDRLFELFPAQAMETDRHDSAVAEGNAPKEGER